MPDAPWLVTRTVQCPRCRADATLSYSLSTDGADHGNAERLVYLCPNLCNLPQDEIAALVDVDA